MSCLRVATGLVDMKLQAVGAQNMQWAVFDRVIDNLSSGCSWLPVGKEAACELVLIDLRPGCCWRVNGKATNDALGGVGVAPIDRKGAGLFDRKRRAQCKGMLKGTKPASFCARDKVQPWGSVDMGRYTDNSRNASCTGGPSLRERSP